MAQYDNTASKDDPRPRGADFQFLSGPDPVYVSPEDAAEYANNTIEWVHGQADPNCPRSSHTGDMLPPPPPPPRSHPSGHVEPIIISPEDQAAYARETAPWVRVQQNPPPAPKSHASGDVVSPIISAEERAAYAAYTDAWVSAQQDPNLKKLMHTGDMLPPPPPAARPKVAAPPTTGTTTTVDRPRKRSSVSKIPKVAQKYIDSLKHNKHYMNRLWHSRHCKRGYMPVLENQAPFRNRSLGWNLNAASESRYYAEPLDMYTPEKERGGWVSGWWIDLNGDLTMGEPEPWNYAHGGDDVMGFGQNSALPSITITSAQSLTELLPSTPFFEYPGKNKKPSLFAVLSGSSKSSKVKSIDPSTPSAPVGQAGSSEPSTSVQAAQPAVPAQEVRPIRRLRHTETIRHSNPIQPVQISQSPQRSETVEPVRPVQPLRLTQTIRHDQPIQLAEPERSPQPMRRRDLRSLPITPPNPTTLYTPPARFVVTSPPRGLIPDARFYGWQNGIITPPSSSRYPPIDDEYEEDGSGKRKRD